MFLTNFPLKIKTSYSNFTLAWSTVLNNLNYAGRLIVFINPHVVVCYVDLRDKMFGAHNIHAFLGAL